MANKYLTFLFCKTVRSWFSVLRAHVCKVKTIEATRNIPLPKPVSSSEDPEEGLFGPHNCALIALKQVWPSLNNQEMKQAFFDCCDSWPYDGVTNKEFNITLRHLGLFDKFEYDDKPGLSVIDFIRRDNETFVLLIAGHFTVVVNGKLIDCSISNKSEVYCSWMIKSSF